MSGSQRVLLVGAGAVGQVFGRYLQAAGREVSFFVKEKHAEEARRGFTLYPLGAFKKHPPPERFTGFGVLVSVEEVARQTWSEVWLCVSSTALREGTWLEELARATGDATWVALQPGPEDRELLLRWVPAERLVTGMIPFISFQAPLKPGEPPAEPGVAYWIPPLTRGPFSGPPERLQEVLRTLRAGGYPAQAQPDTARSAAIPNAVLIVFVDALEKAGWSFERFLQPDSLERTSQAAREAVQVAARRVGVKDSSVLPLLRPALFRTLLPLAAHMAPFDLEAYLKFHFTKVRAQTVLTLRTYAELGRKAGLPVQHLEGAS